MESLIGKSLGDRYKVLGLLGSGGMGDVYLAEHIILGKKMAVKILKDDFSRNEELVRRFQQEAIAASRIGQENIVNVTDFGRTPEGALYFVMEALEGVNLKSLLTHEGQIPLTRAIPILIQVSRALAAAHAQGIIHRDLKAENVMIVARDDGTDLVKVLDFGISKVSALEQAGDANRLTRNGAVMGTPDYMAPEQALGDGVDLRADIYALGVLTYEVVTGTVPFRSASVMEVLVMHMRDRPEPPSQRRPDLNLPADLDAFVLRALEKEPDKRQQTMAEVREELLRCAHAAPFSPAHYPEIGTAVSPMKATPYPLMSSAAVEEAAGFAATSVSLPKPSESAAAAVTLVAPLTAAAPRGRSASRAGWVVAAVMLLGVGGYALVRARPALWGSVAQPTPVAPPPPAPVIAPVQPIAAVPAPVPSPSPIPVVPAPVVAPPVHPQPAPLRHLSDPDLLPVVNRHRPQLMSCLQRHQEDLPAKSGIVHFSVTISESGAVPTARAVTAGFAGKPFESCIVAVFKSLRFPRNVPEEQGPSGGETVVDLPVSYGAKEK